MDDRIVRARIETLRRRAVVRSAPIGGWEARTAAHLAPGEYAFDGAWAGVSAPCAWPAGKTLFLRTSADLPAAADGEQGFLVFDTKFLEGLLVVDGRPLAGVDAEHPRTAAPPAGRRSIEAEFMCVPASFSSPEARRETALLRDVRWEAVHPGMEALAWDVQFAWEAAKSVRDTRRRSLIDAAVESALLVVDLTAPDGELHAAVRSARTLLKGLLASIGSDPEDGKIVLTGHSHIDTAWLWPLRETVRKCGRTFATAARLMERYPDYRFSCSQPQLYAYTKKHFPRLYEEIKGLVRTGRWECTGGMWVEADCNVPSGESLLRQVLHGVAFFRDELGKRPRTCWLPDVFGYPGSLPGILAGCGLSGFYTNKLHWQARNPFPAHLFTWEGIDGSRVTAHIPRLVDYYNGFPNPAQLRAAWEGYNEKAAHQEMLFPFGYGDGGGGPTETMLEFADRARAFPGLPVCRQAVEEDFFDQVSAAAPSLPVWTGELYLETHRGTYTTQSAIKKANRANENALRDAEICLSIAEAVKGAAAPVSEAEGWRGLHAAWENLLLLQFHDILPGSSIGEVYKEALPAHAAIAAEAARQTAAALGTLGASPDATAGSLVLFNTLSWERSDPVQATIPAMEDPVEIVMPGGGTVPAQRVEGDSTRIVFVPRSVPGVGVAFVTVQNAKPAGSRFKAAAQPGGGWIIDSPRWHMRIDHDGAIVSLHDKEADREVVPAGEAANRLLLFQDGPEIESAWNVHAVYEKRPYAWDAPAAMRVVEDGPVRLVLRISRSFRDSRIEQDMILWADLDRIDFVTRAHWEARQVLLKAAFPVAVRADTASYEVQFGAVRRPTHVNTSWDQEKFEVCAHRWMDLSEPGYGVSVLNDSRYGCDVHGSVLRLTLLRGPEWPDPDADRGEHVFTYSLFPHAGDWTGAGTVRKAWELNTPMACAAAAPGAGGGADASRTFVRVDGPAILQALKKAEDGDGWIMRLYEPHGSRGAVTVTGPRPFAAVVACNHVEENTAPHPVEGGVLRYEALPFCIRTFRIRYREGQ